LEDSNLQFVNQLFSKRPHENNEYSHVFGKKANFGLIKFEMD